MAKTPTSEPTENKEIKTSKGSSEKKKKKDKPKAAKSLPGQEKQLEVKLPQEVQDQKIKVRSVIPAKDYWIEARDIAGVSKCVYVNDIHAANAAPLAMIYWLRLIDNPHVIVRCTQDQYLWAIDTLKLKDSDCLITVIDCGSYPTLSYCWQRSKLKNEFPSLDQIKKYEDDNFKDNPTSFHNWPIVPKVREMEAAAKEAAAAAEEDESDSFDWEDEDVQVDGVEVVEGDDTPPADSGAEPEEEDLDWDDE